MKKNEKQVAGRFGALLGAEAVVVLGRRAAALGVEAHLVGGAVRDALLGCESHDYDVTVSGRGRELAEAVAREMGARFVPLGGRDFASFRVVAARGEGEEEPAWELDVWDREGGSLAADLARRDFTINAIAVAVGEDGGGAASLVDPFDGVEDLARRRLRATTEESFRDDPLRVLRLPRFLVQLDGFEAEPATVEQARRAVPGLARVAGERIRDELALILRHERAHRGVAALLEVGVYPALWLGRPASADGVGAAETGAVEAAAAEGAARAVGRVARLEERAAEVAQLASGAPSVDLPAARWALTFAALAPPDAAGAAAEPADLVERFRDAGYVTPGLAARVTKLLAEDEIPSDERGRRRLLHRLGEAWPTAVARLGVGWEDERALAEWRHAVRELAALLSTDGERILDPPRLLSGEDVQRLLGVPPGPEVGRALDRVRRAQVDGEIASREEAERLLLGG